MKTSGWLACVLGLAVGAAACNGADYGDNDTARTDSGISGSAGTTGDGTIRVADLVANPNEYVGRTVTVEADFE